MPNMASPPRARTVLIIVAALRAAIGIGIIALAKRSLAWRNKGAADGSAVLALRIVGVRDLLIGLGTLAAAGDERQLARWSAVGCANDVADAIIAGGSGDLVGKGTAALTAAGSLPFVTAEVWAFSRLRSR
jgi:hypothetical protein